MLMTSVGRFGTEPCFGYIPGEGMARVHLDYNTFGELSTSVAKRLNDIGVEKGDRVALILDNSVQWAALSYGANAIGAAYTAMYTHQHGSEWAYILGDSTPALIAVANTTVLDKLVDNLPAEASAWPKCGCGESRRRVSARFESCPPRTASSRSREAEHSTAETA